MARSALRAWYRRIFSIDEIEGSVMLQWLFGAMLLFFYLSFSRFMESNVATIEAVRSGTAVCWPYFQSCTHLYFLSALPAGYTQTELYMVFFGVMLLIAYLMWKRAWVHAHALMTLLWLWKMFVVFVLSYTIGGVYDYYHLILTMVLLFIPCKEYFLKLTYVLLYFMSVTTKFDATWVLGSYFTALKTGLPLFPTALAPLFTNAVIFSQVILCWFLLSSNRLYQRVALAFFVFFHLYSGILVYYMYPTITLPPLLILFGPLYRPTPTPFSKRALPGVAVVFALLLFQLAGFVIGYPADRRETLEGNRYGMFMFEANHQCIVDVRIYQRDAALASSTTAALTCKNMYCLTQVRGYTEHGMAVRESRYESVSSWNRCDPYVWWQMLRAQCAADSSIARIALQFDHSINGGPFYRIVDVPNICALSYSASQHNDWIRMPPAAPIVGYPVENVYSY